jgi:hypothetical protein
MAVSPVLMKVAAAQVTFEPLQRPRCWRIWDHEAKAVKQIRRSRCVQASLLPSHAVGTRLTARKERLRGMFASAYRRQVLLWLSSGLADGISAVEPRGR